MLGTLDASTPPRARLQWVRLLHTRVFWPACVYDGYDVATSHTHDLSVVRANKPTPDLEDRVVFHFGVRQTVSGIHGTGIAAQTTIVPALRVRVVHRKEITSHVWEGADDFATVCRTHGIDDETIARAEQNSAFVRACDDATRFYEEAHSDNDAKRLFMTFLTARKKRPTTQQLHTTVKVSRPLISRPLTKAAPVEVKENKRDVDVKAPVAMRGNQAASNLQPSCELQLTAELTDRCWSLMDTAGWTTFAKPDGGKIYAMPGVQFFQFRPNETVFETLEHACLKFLQEWTTQNANDTEENNQLHDCFWDIMVASGWQTITSADQVVYVMPNTSFDRFVPNKTIFECKQTAIAKFLFGLGVQAPDNQFQFETGDSDAASASASLSASESEHDTSELDEGSTSDVEMLDADVVICDDSSGPTDESDEDDDNEDARSAIKPTATKRKEIAVKPTQKSNVKKEVVKVQAAPVVPPFKLRQGQVEQELRARGWFWEPVPFKKSPDGYMFYKPLCVDKGEDELRIGQDCFAGYMAVEAYLELFEPDVIETLRREHEAAHSGTTDHTVEVKKVVKTRAVRNRPSPTEKSKVTNVIVISDGEPETSTRVAASRRSTSGGAARRKPARDQIRRYRAPHLSAHDIKFGDVWAVLAERGWFYRPGKFEYDYVKPTKKAADDMVQGKDYFTSRSELEDYLKDSGLWNEIAVDIRRDCGSPVVKNAAQVQVRGHRPPRLSSHNIKFGDVWAVLADRGWFYRPGKFEYDYFKPSGKSVEDMVRGVDYFSYRTELEDYLKDSGLWNDIADEIQRGFDSAEDHDEGHAKPVKRKEHETESVDMAHTPAAKKVKSDTAKPVDFLTPPPAERTKKAAVVSSKHDEIEATQDLTSLMESTNSRISPDNTSSKSRKEEITQEVRARNLNRVFTPSPSAEKNMKPQEASERPLTALERARQSISTLSLAHQPSTFAHRESETNKIEIFCRDCFAAERGSSLYLSGSPGCGKTALLRSLSEQIGQLHEEYGNAPDSIVPVHVNAMGMKDFNQLYCQVAGTLMNKEYTNGDDAFEAIEHGTKRELKRSKTLFLILDEIDALGKSSMESELCRLFELAHRPGHSFILVGVANQIDFTERHLASLRLQLPNVKPQVIVFKPYSFQTINDILVDRLGGATNAASIVNAHGVAFIARKVAAQSGDVRLALDICRRVLQQKLSDVASKGANDFGSPISLIDIVKVIKVVLEGKSKSNVLSLPRNLQMILFATTRLVAQANYVVSTPTSSSSMDDSTSTHKLYRVDDLYDCYCDVSHDAGVFRPLTRGEFKLGLETLSSEGMIGASELKKQLLKLLCTPSELLQTFKNDAYFARLL